MKKLCLMLLCCLLALSPLSSLAETYLCYTGPGEEYQTLDFTITSGVNVTMHTRAYDDQGNAWVQVEVQQGDNLLRVYLPQTQLNGDVSPLLVEQPWEELFPDMLAMPYLPTTPRLGPGTQYNILNYPLNDETQGVIILTENGWGLLELHLEESPVRMWIELCDLQY